MTRLDKSMIPPLARHRAAARAASASASASLALRDSVRLRREPTAVERHGPGWFESSWDLQRGLEVHEGLPADCRWQEWVEVWLRG